MAVGTNPPRLLDLDAPATTAVQSDAFLTGDQPLVSAATMHILNTVITATPHNELFWQDTDALTHLQSM